MSPEVQAAILADADADPKLGYRRLAKLHDQPVDTVRDLVRAHREGRTPKPRARAQARAGATPAGGGSSDGPPVQAPVDPTGDPFDPSTATAREFLVYELKVATWRAATTRNEGVARQWHESATSRRRELDALDAAAAQAEEWKRREEMVDPSELARRVGVMMAVLAKVLPRDEFDNLIAAAKAALPRDA